MKKTFLVLFAFILFLTLVLPKYVSAATPQTNVEFNATATVRYSDWLDGSNSTLDIQVSDLPENTEFSNGVYSGWCIQPRMTGLLHGESAIIYSSLSIALPSELASLPWNKINYVLNHKVRGEGKSDLEFFKDVQTAIWLLVGDDDPEFGISPEAQKMVDDANANAGYMPGNGDIVAFVVYSDGINLTKDDFVQEVIIEVVLQLPPTETPTPTVTLTTTTSPPAETVTTTPSPTETVTVTPSPTTTVPPTSTSPTPTETLTITPTSTFTPTPTLTSTPVCVPTVVRADFSRVAAGQSVEGWNVVAPGLNIDAKGTAVSLRAGIDPRAYGAPNDAPGGNTGLSAGGGFSDISTQSALQAHLYTFTFAPGTSVSNFTLHMLDYGDWNVVSSTSHYVSLTAYNANGAVVAKQELSFTTLPVGLPRSSDLYGDLWFTGDAVTALPGQPGNWTWNVSGSGIVRVVLEFGAGHDPNVAFDTLTFTAECPQACVSMVASADFSHVAAGQSVEGWNVVAPGLNIDAKGTAVSLRAGIDPRAYGAPNDAPGGNTGLSAGGGFSDISTQSALQAHLYTFTFAPGTSVSNFTLHMLDYGDWNVVSSTSHYVSLTAYNANGAVVAKQELSFTTPAVGLPRSSDKYGDLWFTGDAVTALPGQPGNWTWNVSGSGIVRLVLEFGAGHDPNVAFDTLNFTTECP